MLKGEINKVDLVQKKTEIINLISNDFKSYIINENNVCKYKQIMLAMLELGPHAQRLHEDVGRRIAGMPIDHLVGIGSEGRLMIEAATAAGFRGTCTHVASSDEPDLVAGLIRPGDRVLLKASRGIGLERVLESLAHLREVAQ